MKKQTYRLSYKGVVFHSTGEKAPPKLVRLGSGEILQWKNTTFDREIPGGYGRIAEYREAEIVDFSYLHTSESEPV